VSFFASLKNDTVTVAPLTNAGRGGDLDFGTRESIDVRLRSVTEQERSEIEETLNVGVVLTTDEYEFAADDAIWLPGANTNDAAESYQPVEVTDDTTLQTTLSQAYL